VPLLIALAAVAAGWVLYNQFQEEIARSEPVAVPLVEGMPEDEAVARLRRAGFTVDVQRAATNEQAPGIVFEQSPREGTRLARGEDVTITVSTGPPKVAVPNVVGRPFARATEMLRDAELRWRTTEVFSAKPAGEVLAQNPPGGTDVEKATVVRLRVSKGVETSTVPDVLNQSQESAEAELRGAGFAVDAVAVESNAEAGLVVDQEPNPGVEAEKGSTVVIEVSEGPALATVPDVVGSERNVAREALRSAGFQVQVEEQETLDPLQDKLVIAQSPEGGADAEAGGTVTIVVGKLVTP
jgi:serine/threonine-protein kinase